MVGQEVEVKRLSIRGLLPDTDYYMTYDGSTTMPACHETVTWVILNKPIYITKQQVGPGTLSTIIPSVGRNNERLDSCFTSLPFIISLETNPFHAEIFGRKRLHCFLSLQQDAVG
jgi:carbonic anhydrase